jgi:hypothetical protein
MASRNRLLDAYKQSVSITRQSMPEADSMEKYLHVILPQVRQWSEDLREERYFLRTHWMEFRDDDNFHENILHIFNEGGEYLRITNGDAESGSWRLLDGSNKILIEHNQPELYKLAFLNENFFILSKQGDQSRLGRPVFFVMVRESLGVKIEWMDAMEILHKIKFEHSKFYQIMTAIVIIIVAMAVIYSLT